MIDIQPLSQTDPAWKNKKLGNDTITIGKFGCLLTCMAMVANSYGFKETPDTLNDKMKAAGGFQGALVIPAAMPNALPGIIYRNFIQCRDQPAPVAEIDASLAASKPVIIEVDYSPAQGLQNHWVVLYAKQADDYLIRDPWPYPVETKVVSLTSRYGFAGNIRAIIQGAVWIDSSGAVQPPKPKPAPKAVPATGFTVYAAADGLALRTDPFLGDNLIKRVPLNAKLYVTEPVEAAKGKIGAVNQWLKVQDTDEGYEGYAAAWYVAAQPAAQPQSAPSDASRRPTGGSAPVRGDRRPGAAQPARRLSHEPDQIPAAQQPAAVARARSPGEGEARRRRPVVEGARYCRGRRLLRGLVSIHEPERRCPGCL